MKPLSPSRTFSALLCIDSPDLLEITSSQLTVLGFEVHTAAAAETAISLLHSHFYDLVAVEEEFGGGDAETHPILAEIAALPLEIRRAIFVVLLGAHCATGSEMEAFALSVDLVVGRRDAENFKALAGQGLARQEEFYAAYKSVAKLVQGEG